MTRGDTFCELRLLVFPQERRKNVELIMSDVSYGQDIRRDRNVERLFATSSDRLVDPASHAQFA